MSARDVIEIAAIEKARDAYVRGCRESPRGCRQVPTNETWRSIAGTNQVRFSAEAGPLFIASIKGVFSAYLKVIDADYVGAGWQRDGAPEPRRLRFRLTLKDGTDLPAGEVFTFAEGVSQGFCWPKPDESVPVTITLKPETLDNAPACRLRSITRDWIVREEDRIVSDNCESLF